MLCMRKIYTDARASARWPAAQVAERSSTMRCKLCMLRMLCMLCMGEVYRGTGLRSGQLVRGRERIVAVVPMINRSLTSRKSLFKWVSCSWALGYALHEKGLQRQIGDSPLVCSKERRVLKVPRMHCRSTTGQPLCLLFLRFKFPDMPCMKRVYRDKKASVHWSAARTKERFSSS